MAEEPDVGLTVALAEYEHLREARRGNNDESSARFNFFLVLATAATAVAGGLITGGGSGAAAVAAVIGLGGLVLLLGLTVFVRLVEFRARNRLYAVAIDSVRTYLARRAPDVAPYMIMPTLDAPGVYQGRPPGGGWVYGTISLAGTVCLINSALIGVGTGVAVRHAGAVTWVALTAGLLALAVAVSLQVGYLNLRSRAARRRIQADLDARPRPADPVPAPRSDPRPGEAVDR
ncbi:hypothetical protein AB0J86_22560 [Micromonospora sp. NPDC049559]|uniref:hypothetical protein n=1 Tax=Micromonospora sp. NPDC049559 TaxID=3155923 RepID=UPI0034443406